MSDTILIRTIKERIQAVKAEASALGLEQKKLERVLGILRPEEQGGRTTKPQKIKKRLPPRELGNEIREVLAEKGAMSVRTITDMLENSYPIFTGTIYSRTSRVRGALIRMVKKNELGRLEINNRIEYTTDKTYQSKKTGSK